MQDGVTSIHEVTPFQLDEYRKKLEIKRDGSVLEEKEKHPLRERPIRIKSVEKKRPLPLNFAFKQEQQQIQNQSQPPVVQKVQTEKPLLMESRKKPIRLTESKRRQAQTAIKTRPGQEKASNVTIQNFFTNNKYEENKEKLKRPNSQARPRRLMSPNSEESVNQQRGSKQAKEIEKKIDVAFEDIKFPIRRMYQSPGPSKSMSKFQRVQNIYSKNLPMRNPLNRDPRFQSRSKKDEQKRTHNLTFQSQRNQMSETQISQQRAISASRGVASQKVS